MSQLWFMLISKNEMNGKTTKNKNKSELKNHLDFLETFSVQS